MATKKRSYHVTITFKGGETMEGTFVSPDAACALGMMLDSMDEEREPQSVLVRSDKMAAPAVKPKAKRRSRRTTEAQAVDAVAKLLSGGIDANLRSSKVVEAYAAGLLGALPRGQA